MLAWQSLSQLDSNFGEKLIVLDLNDFEIGLSNAKLLLDHLATIYAFNILNKKCNLNEHALISCSVWLAVFLKS